MHEAVIPCGCFVIEEGGRIERYSPVGAQAIPGGPAAFTGQRLLAVLPPKVGDCARSLLRNLLQDTPEGPGSALAEVNLALGHRSLVVRLGLVRAASPNRFIVTVNRIRGEDLELRPNLERDVARGTVSDGVRRVLAASDDFFAAFNAIFSKGLSFRRQQFLNRFGKQWGMRHILRIERIVQRSFGLTLREVEAQMAIEALSESLGVLGLGHFDLDLSHRPSGVLVVVHHGSPFPTYGSSPAEGACSLLAGFYAALLSYLSGRQLAAREVSCSSAPERPCRFVVATEERLTKLMVARPGSSDHELLVQIGVDAAVLAEPTHHDGSE
jgi:predicted hydrocarbon binding protein